ncbi:MAG: hypothetical protein P9M15_03035 [Candidatus Electryoneaceae bacterium]|nr:hypothetical protein [Candidatus Electryoneaceae bacterium]
MKPNRVLINRYWTATVFVVLITAMLMSGCEEDGSPTDPGEPIKLIPLSADMQWIYDTEGYENDSLIYRNTDTMTVSGAVLTWGGSYWHYYNGEYDVYWRNGVDGIWRLRMDDDNPNGLAEKYYEFPTRAGEKWFVPSDDDTVSVVSITETVEVPAGTFEGCYYYRFIRADGGRQVSTWVKPDIGIVQRTMVEFVDGDTLRSSTKLIVY